MKKEIREKAKLFFLVFLVSVFAFPFSSVGFSFALTSSLNGDLASNITFDFKTKLSEIRQKTDLFSRTDILVKFKSDSPENLSRFSKIHLPSSFRKKSLGVYSFRFGDNNFDLFKKLEELNKDPAIEFAEPNYMAYAFSLPNDPLISYQWNFGKNGLDMEKVWAMATGKGAVVAVIDTGVAYEKYRSFVVAPDLANTSFVQGYNFVSDSIHANDDNGHGTHVVGTIAQSTNNGFGTAGMAFSASIMPIKVLDKNGSGGYADIAEGIVWAADHSAQIINLSLGGPYPSRTLEQALKYAKSKNVTIVAASGNDGANSVSYPAAYDDYAIAVGASRYDKSVTNYSNKGVSLDVVAPGGDLNVDQDNNGFGDGILQQTFGNNPSSFNFYFFQGTSMATPHVSALAALLVEKGVTSPDEIRKIIQDTADDIYVSGRDNISGFGLINPYKALLSAVQKQQPVSTPTLTPTPTPTSVVIESTPEKSIHISEVSLTLERSLLKSRAVAKVKVADNQGKPVKGVLVNGFWSGLATGEAGGVTSNDGAVVFTSKRVWNSLGEFRFQVKSIKIDGYVYKPEDNLATSGTVGISKK